MYLNIPPKEGTVASKMDNQIHGEIKQNRSERLIALGEELSNNFNESFFRKRIYGIIRRRE